MQTAFTKAFNTRWPIVSAAMTMCAGPSLAAAAHRGGALGFLASHKGAVDVESYKQDIQTLRKELGIPTGRLPIGSGCLGWALDKAGESQAFALLDAIIANSSAIWLSFGSDLGKYAKYVKQNSSNGFKLVILASTVQEARTAVANGADAIIVQGIEAGGHGSSKALPLLTILPMVVADLGVQRPLLLAAGGIVTGSQAAAALVAGADAVVLGTALLATPESLYKDAQKKAIIGSQGNATARTMIFDIMRGTLSWPEFVDGRALVNDTLTQSLDGKSHETLKEEYAAALKQDDVSRICVWAGTSVSLVKEIRPAAEVVESVGQDIRKHLQRANSFLAV